MRGRRGTTPYNCNRPITVVSDPGGLIMGLVASFLLSR